MYHFRFALFPLLALMLFACSDSDTPSPAAKDTSLPSADTAVSDRVSELDLGGIPFVIYTDEYSLVSYGEFFNSEAETGFSVSDAAYRRTRAVEERLNVDLSFTDWIAGDDIQTFISSVMAGTGEYDLLHSSVNTDAIIGGTVLDVTAYDALDLSQPYYMQYINEEMNMEGRQYTVTGYFDMETISRTASVFFSSKLAQQYNVGDLYAMVENNEWTFDRMLELASGAYQDLNGDSVMAEGDQFGLCGGCNMNGMLIMSTGYRFSEVQSDGTRALTGINELLLDFNQMLFDTYSSTWYYNCYPSGGTNRFAEAFTEFTADKYLFFLYDVSNAKLFSAEMEDYGILPIPKFTEDQENYTSYCRPFMTSLPKNAKDPTNSCWILEALNMYSYDLLLPAYYEVALSNRYASSPKASRMMDLIFSNICCDFTQMWYTTIGLFPAMHNTVGVHENYISFFESVEKKVNGALTEIFNTVSEVND